MNIHEYQGKAIFKEYGVLVPNGFPAFSVEEAMRIYDNLNVETAVVKAQIHAGGRGKGGGVQLAHNRKDVEHLAKKMLGMNLITHQTGPEGKEVQRLLIEEAVEIERELYAGIVLDRENKKYAIMVSTEGGMEIEQVAAESPEKIVKEWIDPSVGIQSFQLRKLVFGLGLHGVQVKHCTKALKALWYVFTENDCSLIEINPLVLAKDDRIIALDAKINFDDNGLFRHKNIAELRDTTEEDSAEVEADKHNLNYIKLDGNVGCMVNGAGLAMATMDIIKLYGGEPANFLDVGGVANAETVANGFKIILSDKNVKSILINIFGGIVRCDRVAQGVVDAIKSFEVEVPVIVRLEGTNAKQAAELLHNSNFEFQVAINFEDAADKAVKATKEITI